ncbi:MFS transporter [Dictyobacter aurantiacus]|uniref:MFS transporter n=1 Tax=Dictyobacter aurantiacus TaxID=1936993 RepID=A0A401ZJC3_9CHLR|nr:MFS transporter [Dictyobacter aurantiacus]GCE06940.1 MFS transporter [Dictyobacter aurantiacus]
MFPRFSKRLLSGPKLALLINRNYTLLWLGGAISLIGDTLFTMTLILWVGTLLQNQSAAPLAVSGVALAAALPALLIGPFAGVFVDRWPKLRTMRLMDALRAVLVCSLLPISEPLPLPLAVKLTIIYLVVAAVSALSQFFTPATKAILKEVVPEEQLTRASALIVGAVTFGWALGPSCAGIFYVSLGAGWAIALNVASFACSWVLIGRMRVSAAESRASAQPTSLWHVLTELREGLRFIQGQLQLRTILLTQSLFSFGWGIVSVMAFFYITQNIHVPMSLFGLLSAAPPVGGILGALLVGRAAAKVGATSVYARAFLFAGVMIVVSTVPNQVIIDLVGFTLIGIATMQAEALVGSLVLFATPEQMVGRVFSTLGTVTALSSLLATFLSGYLSSTLLQGVVIHLPTGELNATNLLLIGAGVLIFAGGLHASRQFRKRQ